MNVPTARHPKPARLAACALILCFCAVSPAVEAHALSLASPASSASPASPVAPPVGNGGFETPPTTGQAFQDTGSSLGAWKVTAGSVDLIGVGGPLLPAKGKQSLDLTGYRPGTIEQTIPTTAGRCYTVSFALAGNTFGPPVVKAGYARVTQGPLTVQKNFTFDITGKTPLNMGYVRERLHFCAEGPEATLSLVSTTNGAYGPAIDDVTVTPRLRSAEAETEAGARAETPRRNG
ncbi:choice-of-anchor C family protein [Streptosporangium subroseum]|uniref:choice-of-anchor C family protein n=1 Tax=Streptosporangium subroseum TaxID=106412 RepID=UPI003092C391|nr:choice-of-anchor C family protein [Streptosporangium subroseum]